MNSGKADESLVSSPIRPADFPDEDGGGAPEDAFALGTETSLFGALEGDFRALERRFELVERRVPLEPFEAFEFFFPDDEGVPLDPFEAFEFFFFPEPEGTGGFEGPR